MLDIERKKASTKPEVEGLLKKKGKPEVQVHCAATFVWAGDPTAITKEQRDQQEYELGQFAVAMKHGLIDKKALDQVFSEFRFVIEKKLRDAGALRF